MRILKDANLMIVGMVVLFVAGVLTASSYALDPKTCVGMWLFDEGSGTTAKDSSGNGNDGELMGGPKWVAGKFGKALEFDGVDDCVDCGKGTSLKAVAELTIQAWINTTDKTTGGQGGSEYCVVHRIDVNAPYRGYSFGRDGTGNYVFFYTGELYAGPHKLIGKTYVISDGAWHHIAATYDGTTSKIYVDGKLDIEAAKTSAFASDVSCQIGRDPWRWYRGLIDDVAVFNVALTEVDVKNLMKNGVKRGLAPVSPNGRLTTVWGEIKAK